MKNAPTPETLKTLERPGHQTQLTVCEVQRYFEANAQIGEFRFGPHGRYLSR